MSTSLRKPKFHEKKLIKHALAANPWKGEAGERENKVLRTYHIQKREDYVKYNRLVGKITSATARLKKLDPKDPFRTDAVNQLLEKLYNMGLITTKKGLSLAEKLTASAFCRRRLPVVMVRAKMCETLKQATTYIEQGHIRVGPNTVTDPAFLVTRPFEDLITWNNGKIREHLTRYHDKLDDYDLLNATS